MLILTLALLAACTDPLDTASETLDSGSVDAGDSGVVDEPTCGAITTFETGKTPTAEVHVATTGSDASGDGSAASPYASLERAADDATPGTAIVLHAGTYGGGEFLEKLHGTDAAPIWVGGAAGEAKPLLDGASEGLHLIEAQYVVVHDLEVSGQASNGINADDGGTYEASASHHLVFRGLHIHDVGSGGNQDCLKLSGLYDLWVLDSTFERCGGGSSGSGVDFVGGHRALVAGNTFRDLSANAVQVKGGSADVTLRGNHLINAGHRGFNMGGSTGFQYFRPPLSETSPNAEAWRVVAENNLIEGAIAPWGFVGCVDCAARHNTVVHPEKWLTRILQETTSDGTYSFEPAKNGQITNNLFVFRRSDVSTDVNIGGNTDPDSFVWTNNLFFASDGGDSTPSLPGTETGSIVGLDPLLDASGHLSAGSPAIGSGVVVGGADGDRDGDCWGSPPSVGADEP